MKIFLVSLFLVLLICSFGLELILLMGYSSYEEVKRNREALLTSDGVLGCTFARVFFFFADHRIAFGSGSLLGLLLTLIY
jgi:hypothetical protein